MKKTIGIVAHVDAGKTTFSEQLLFLMNRIKHKGRVDHKNTYLDNHDIERQRGITVFAEQAYFQYDNCEYYLIDTPGHVDFSSEMERTLSIIDIAIVIVSAVEGIESHTETVLQMLRKRSIPTFIFINKIDRTGADVDLVLKQFAKEGIADVLLMETEELDADQLEWIAERDEQLLEQYVQGQMEQSSALATFSKLVMSAQAYPCVAGSALYNDKVELFFRWLHRLTTDQYEDKTTGPLQARVYKIKYDQAGTRIVFAKLLCGSIHVRAEVNHSDGHVEKITQLRKYHGQQYEAVSSAVAGDLVAIVGLNTAAAGESIGEPLQPIQYELIPTLRSQVVFEQEVNRKEALALFKRLEAEDPILHVQWNEKHSQIEIQVMGAIQLEVLQQVVSERFGLRISFAKPQIVYKETISSLVVGYGHFEPLRHYAEVHLKLEPNPRGAGVTFSSQCHVDELSAASQRLIGQHVMEREHNGILTGFGLTDVHITLLRGREHNKHTHGGDFREATFRAIRQALEKAENVLLEPVYSFKIVVNQEQIGRVISDVQMAYGQLEPLENDGGKVIATGIVPVATFLNYSTQLAAFTQGKGRISLKFAGYSPCHNQADVIEQLAYNKDADPEYTSSSIFCAKGAGYSVKWDEAEAMMHIQ